MIIHELEYTGTEVSATTYTGTAVYARNIIEWPPITGYTIIVDGDTIIVDDDEIIGEGTT